MKAGFSVTFVGPEGEVTSGGVQAEAEDTAGGGRGEGGPGVEAGGGTADGDDVQSTLYVDEDTFGVWMGSAEFSFGGAVQRWWVDLQSAEEGCMDGMKHDDDETAVEFFRRIRMDLERGEVAEESEVAVAVRGGEIWVPALVSWLEEHMGVSLGGEASGNVC